MSIKALNWAFSLPLQGAQKWVLIALANSADHEAKAFPSVPTIALHAGIQERAARLTLRRLEAMGIIRTEQKNGNRSTYFIDMTYQHTPALHAPLTPVLHAPGSTCPPALHAPLSSTPGGDLTPKGGSTCPQTLVRKKERKEKKDICSDESKFDQFWISYPRKAGKGAARKAWGGAMLKTTPEIVLTSIAAYVWPDDPQYIPHPATWLNQERWLDEAPKPKLTTDQKIMRAVGLFDDDEIPPQEMRMLQ